MDTKNYLDRIAFYGAVQPDLPALKRLQRQHLLTVPFENLSIHYGEPIVLDTDRLFDKVVRRRRGGFCYELNGLFYVLLRALGYQARMISARVRDGRGGFGPEFDHMALIVELPQEGPFLVDVGFGRFASEPLQLIIGHDQPDGPLLYRIARHSSTHFKVMHSDRGMPFDDDYLFSLLGQDLEDYEERCLYHQTAPESHFTQTKICSRMTEEGRLSLSSDKLVITRRVGGREEIPVTGEEDFREKLRTYFGIDG